MGIISKIIIITLLLSMMTLLIPSLAFAQNNTNVDNGVNITFVKDTAKNKNFLKRLYQYFANTNKQSTKKFDVSLIGGPSYSNDVKFGLGLLAAGLYRTSSNAPLSNVSLYGQVTTTGYYLLGIKGNNIFENEKIKIIYNSYFYSFPSYIWGVGYKENNNNDSKSKYLKINTRVSSSILFKLTDNIFIGPTIEYNFVRGSRFSDTIRFQNSQNIFRGINVGATVTYDSRDFIPNPSKGVNIKLLQSNYIYPNTKPHFNTSITANYYHNAWKGAIIALDLYSEFNYGSTPWTMLAALGGSNRMRGYYEGRYRDNNMFEIQAELRQKIYNRNGIALWVGAGNVYGDYNAFAWKNTLPNYGIGYRWEFKKRVNVRLDYGIGKSGQSSFIFSIEEAF